MSFTAPEDAFLDVNDAHLRVYGNVHADGLKLGQLEIVTTTSTGSTIQFLHQHTAFTTTSNIEVGTTNHDLFVDTKNSRVGILTNTPTEALDVTGTVKATAFDGNGALLTGIPSSAINGTLSQWTTVTGPKIHYSDGNVGIGIADPLHTLDVVGDINFTGTLREDGNPFVSTPWTIESGPTALSYTLGNVGIGAVTPSAKLEVTGNAHVSTDLSVGGNLTINTISAAATHGLGAVTALSNTSADTVLLTNTGTSLVASGSIDVSGVVGTSETGALTVPSGTTEQQPSTGLAGMIRFNSTLNRLEVYNGTAWQSVGRVNASQSAGSGTTTISGGYKIHTFTSSGTFTVITSGEFDYLVVAGGGGGGSGVAGGGGAGGMLTGSRDLVSGSYTITVGAGGVGGIVNDTYRGTSGDNSSIANLIVADGGGAGASSYDGGPGLGALGGGSGGGGSNYTHNTSISSGGSGTSGQGNNGGNSVANSQRGGGGGGAGSAGSNSTVVGNGGNGLQSSISGTNTYYAGGGGGGANGTPGTGGNGGGGNGGNTYANGNDGTDGLGGGGGAGWAFAAGNGGSGGDGIVIIRYLA